MADMTDPFVPQGAATGGPGIMEEWTHALQSPQIRGALLQAGISLMQPPSFGDTTAGQIGRAIGGAGEYLSREEESARKERELSSKEDLRSAQATNAEARANAAGANAAARASQAETAAERLKRVGETEEGKRDRHRLSSIIRAQNLYQQYVKDINKQNADVMRDPKLPKEPILSFDAWVERNPMMRDALKYNLGGGTADTGTIRSDDPLEGKTATGPNGARVIRRGGEWVPL